MMKRRKYKFKGVFLTVLRRIVTSEELEKFLFTVAKKGTYYVNEVECIQLQYFDGIAEKKRIKNLLVDVMLFRFHMPCLFHLFNLLISFLNA
jgi:hypothetical protein